MRDTRQALPPGTRVKLLSTGSVFEISGEPIGFGGGGIIYPARRRMLENGRLLADGICYALKECYPASEGPDYCRGETGEITAVNPACSRSLEDAKRRYTTEKERNQAIHVTANRMLPILEAADRVELTQPGREPVCVCNAVSVMESLENKGRSLSDCLAERRRFSALEACRILQQLLFALREVHNAGYLHLDIQGGNVFLRGTLRDKSDFVTLIDFGSARPTLKDGKTEELRDRAIFTSQGFSAPEMLLNNTGSLRLGREADIYSLGCIGLYLLTGQRPNLSQLLANRSGNYLKPNQLRRIDCPVHLRDRLQELLAKALAKRPEDRFPSADKMLEQVNELLEALQPGKTALGTMAYDAFICYKHGPIDSPAAKALQQRLERFQTTDNAGKRIRPFRRVFLDEGELAACADFGQQIHDALENSKWLLVVCSPDTPLSPWVDLEIETFLKLHGPAARNRILTVLTSGDPKASFPPKLLEEQTGGREPFAVDLRADTPRQLRKKLKGDPFLRLAATMLDRPFDALKQRQRAYFLQRVAVVTGACLVAAVGFAAYAGNRANVIAAQSEQIQEEYEKALINESLLLAEQAEKLLKNNDPLEAMALALNALPSPEQDRPVVAEAEYVLGKALGIYVAPGEAENTATPVSSIDTDDSCFFLDDTGSLLFTWESYEEGLRVWDAQTLTLIRELLPQEDICYASRELLIPERDSLLLRVYNRVFCVNYRTGEQNWCIDAENIRAVCLSGDGTGVVLLTEKETGPRLELFSAETGARQGEIPFQTEPKHSVEMCLVLSPDGRWAAVPAANSDSENVMYAEHALYLICLEDGSCRKLLDSDTQIVKMFFREGRLVLLRGSGYTLTTREGNAVYQYAKPIHARIESYDSQSGKLLWCSEQQYSISEDGSYALELVPYDSGTASGKGLLATYFDHCVLLDWDSGQVVRSYTLPSAVLDVRYGTNGFRTINADGSSSSASYTMDTVASILDLVEHVSAACRHGDSLYVQSTPLFSKDYSIRKYELGKYDESYSELFEADVRYSGYYAFCRADGGPRLVVANMDYGTNESQVTYLDGADGTVLTYALSEDLPFSAYRVLGSSPDGQRLYWYGNDVDYDTFWITNRDLWVTDLLTGESRQVTMPSMPEAYMVVMDTLYYEEALYFSATVPRESAFDLYILRWDMAEGSLEELYRYAMAPAEDPQDEVGKYQWEDYQYNSLVLDEDTRQLSFATVTNGSDMPRNLIRLDLSGEKTGRICVGFTPEICSDAWIQWERYCYRWSPDGTWAVIGFGDCVYGVGAGGDMLFRVPAKGYCPVACILPDGQSLLMLTDELELSQYRSRDGACLATIDLKDYRDNASILKEEAVRLTAIEEATAVLFTGYDGFLLDTSGENVKIKAVVEDGFEYDPQTDSFLVAQSQSYSGSPASVGSFRRYSLEELIRKANAILDRQS